MPGHWARMAAIGTVSLVLWVGVYVFVRWSLEVLAALALRPHG